MLSGRSASLSVTLLLPYLLVIRSSVSFVCFVLSYSYMQILQQIDYVRNKSAGKSNRMLNFRKSSDISIEESSVRKRLALLLLHVVLPLADMLLTLLLMMS